MQIKGKGVDRFELPYKLHYVDAVAILGASLYPVSDLL